MLGCSISFIMTTSLSIPKGIKHCPRCAASVSMTARLSVLSSSAAFLLTIFTAARWPVAACFAALTLPDAPLPNVLPRCHGPTCVFRLDFFEAFVEVPDA